MNSASKSVENTQKLVSQDQQQIKQAATTLDSKKSELSKNQQDLANAQGELSQNKIKVSESEVKEAQLQKIVDSNKDKVSSAQKDFSSTNSQLTSLKEQLGSINTISLPSDYVDALNNYNQASGDEPLDKFENRLIDIANRELSKQEYKHNKNDQKRIINKQSDLNSDILGELSNYAANLINPLRAAFGNQSAQPFQVTDNSVKFAQEVANNYNNDKWSLFDHEDHDVPAITKAASKYGLDNGDNYYEDAGEGELSYSDQNRWDISVDSIKEAIYNTIQDMIFATDEWMHADGLLSQGYTAPWDLKSNFYFAVNIDNMGIVHLLDIDEAQIEDHSKFDSKRISDNSVNPEVLKSQINKNEQVLTSQKQILDASTSQLNSSTTTLATQDAELAKSKQALSQNQNKINDLVNAISNLKNQISTTSNAYSKAVTKLNTDTSVLNSSKLRLSNAESELKDKAAQNKTKLVKYNEAQKIVEIDNKKISRLNKKMSAIVSNLNSHKKDLSKNKKAVAKLVKKMKQLNKQLSKDENKLRKLLTTVHKKAKSKKSKNSVTHTKKSTVKKLKKNIVKPSIKR
ncbi:SEC10/PgrA surface exclusion domain-containing protein [Pediococcus argentinicus]|uniref:SEC10/PgrA surface exclusion domain-containing protein n=1 Tax=Pediococcus argentinicus TaxID=480391 RepID=UPI00338D563D